MKVEWWTFPASWGCLIAGGLLYYTRTFFKFRTLLVLGFFFVFFGYNVCTSLNGALIHCNRYNLCPWLPNFSQWKAHMFYLGES